MPARALASTCPLREMPCHSCNAARRWYATQALPLVFIGGLVVFLAVDAGRVSPSVHLAMVAPVRTTTNAGARLNGFCPGHGLSWRSAAVMVAFSKDDMPIMPPPPPPHGCWQTCWMKRKGWGGHAPANVDRCDPLFAVRCAVKYSASLNPDVCVLTPTLFLFVIACGIGMGAVRC
jgi:hypothetical protein